MAESQLHLHTSNRVENLAARLVEISQSIPLSHTLSQETVMTLNPGIARWLQFEIAQLTGVSFGWDFPLPGKLFSRVLRGFEPTFDVKGAFLEDLARWHLLEILSKLEDQTRFAQIRSYCKSGEGSKRFSFARQLVKLFDEYLVYRPDQIIDWEDKPDATKFDWQAELWRRLVGKLYPKNEAPRHIARLWYDLQKGRILELGIQPDHWPERLFVFGISSLAPLYLDLLSKLSAYRPVHLFLLQPSDLYWSDLKTRKQIQKIVKKRSRKGGVQVSTPEDWLYETGNPLLPSLGKQGQMFLDLLIDKDPIQDDETFEPPEEDVSQLRCLQSDIFTIEDRDTEKGSAPFPSYDGTIQIHSCSSRRREVETIWDLIVGRLEADPKLKANDILVMAPDIQRYRSHIESVFESKRGTELEIPFSIADRTANNRPGVFSGLFAVLKSVSQRASSAEIIALVESPLLREVFGFTDQELECIEFWIRDLGITWGWEASHRAQFSSFATDRNTWKELRLRLISGSLFSSDAETPFGFLAYSEIEADLSDTAGRFLECLQMLRELRALHQESFTLGDWQTRILSLLDSLRSDREPWQRDYSQATEYIKECLPNTHEVFASGLEVFTALADKFESTMSGGGYLSGGVTFCSLKPMRAIPANTVCLMGMNRLDFPRRNTRLSFDLLAKVNRIGDRNTRDEDRQFFLETLLSVRSHLLISYEGIPETGDVDNEPSAVVEELLNYLRDGMKPDDFKRVLVRQKRQSFDPFYFNPDQFKTWDPGRAALRNRFSGIENNRIDRNLSSSKPVDDLPQEVELMDLVRFFCDPSRYFAIEIAKINLGRTEEALNEIDQLTSSPLNTYKLRERFADLISRGRAISDLRQEQAAHLKLLPLGKLEQPTFLAEKEAAEVISNLVGYFETQTRYLECEVAGVNLFGESIVRKSDGRQIIVQTGDLNPKRVLDCWIRHVFSSALNPDFTGRTVVFSMKIGTKPIQFAAIDDPKAILAVLVSNFLHGQLKPIPFFPSFSETAAKTWSSNSSETEENRMATVVQEAGWNFRNSRSLDSKSWQQKHVWSEYDQVCFGNDYEPDENFVKLAVDVWKDCHSSMESYSQPALEGGKV